MQAIDRQTQKELDALEEQLKRGKIGSSHLVAEKVTNLFKKYIANWRKVSRFETPANLLSEVKRMGDQIIKADKLNFVVPNTVKRILHVIREACRELKLDKDLDAQNPHRSIGGMADFGAVKSAKGKQSSDDSSLDSQFKQQRLDALPKEGRSYVHRSTVVLPRAPAGLAKQHSLQSPDTGSAQLNKQQTKTPRQIRREEKQQKKLTQFKEKVLQYIEDISDDIQNVVEEVNRQASEHINEKDIILTFSQSDLLCTFLEAASRTGDGEESEDSAEANQQNGKKDFDVFVCETAPNFSGHATAKRLHKAGLHVSLITDASVYALMSRVDKVIISTHAIMANGGLVAHSGAYQIALAAKEHSIPVIVVSAMYKLTPTYPFDPMKLNELLAPTTIMNFEDGDCPENFEAIVPAFDYVPPELISLFITNQGGFTPNYIYRQFSDAYSKEEKYEDAYR